MLTEAENERQAFEEHDRMRQYVRDYVKAKARRDIIRRHNAEWLDDPAKERFECILSDCEKSADEIAFEAAAKASEQAVRTELSVAAYEVAYIETYANSLPALLLTGLASTNLYQTAA
jgi:Lon protease-like protein